MSAVLEFYSTVLRKSMAEKRFDNFFVDRLKEFKKSLDRQLSFAEGQAATFEKEYNKRKHCTTESSSLVRFYRQKMKEYKREVKYLEQFVKLYEEVKVNVEY